MQKVNFELYTHLKKHTQVHLIAWGGAQLWMPFIGILFFIKAIVFILIKPNIKVIFLGDAALAPLGRILQILTGRKIAVMTHGLDITWANSLYQMVIPACLKKFDKLFCVSNRTREECELRAVPSANIKVIPNGISEQRLRNPQSPEYSRSQLGQRLNLDIKHKKIILSIGRLVERKGVHSFIRNIYPDILANNKDAVLIIAGDGPFRSEVEKAIADRNVQDSVHLLGRVDDDVIEMLYEQSDVFIMPNIPVPGDMEGFGIVAIEAGAAALPVVATGIEGIKDAISDGENGFQIAPSDYAAFAKKVSQLINNENDRIAAGMRAQDYVRNHYTWPEITERYLHELNNIANA